MTTLTLEDLLVAARCVALWQRAGADPLAMARHIRGAAERADSFRKAERRVHPKLGDGTVAAASSSLCPGRSGDGPALSMQDLLPALGAVVAALSEPTHAPPVAARP